MLDTECSTESSVEEFEFSSLSSTVTSSREEEESDCFMGMIVSGTAGLLTNRSVKKSVIEERMLPVCRVGLTVKEEVRILVNFLNRPTEGGVGSGESLGSLTS